MAKYRKACWVFSIAFVCVAECSGAHRAIPDAASSLPDPGIANDVTDDYPANDLADVIESPEVVAVEVVDACTPGVVVCLNGSRRVCNKDGAWVNDPCPAGHVCEKGACVQNVSYVYIVVDNATPIDFMAGLTDPSVLAAADNTSCELGKMCCESPDGAGPRSSVTAGRVVKYWVRRLVSDLADDEHIRFVLLRPPSIESGDPRWLCDLSLASPFPAVCAGRYYQILDMDTVEQGMSSALGVDYSKGLGPWRWYPAAIPIEGPVLSAAWAFLTRLVAAGPGATAGEVLKWVNEVETTEPTGAACSKDADCFEGFCLEAACRRHIDPEIALWPLRNYQPLPWYAYLAMGVAGTSEGDLCNVDAECRIPEFRCGPDKRCHDDARHCRRRHIVLVSTFSEVEPILDSQCKAEYDVAPSLWTHWFRWGCGCRSRENCPDGASCIDSGACDVTGPVESCWKFNECMPDDLQAVLDGGPPFDPFGSMFQYFNSVCSAFPSMAPRDRNGETMRATVHSLVTHLTTDLLDVENMTKAAGAAIIGGGKFVTPCRSDMLFGWGGGVETCDYEAQYQSLVQQIRQDLSDSVCEPE